MQVMLKPGQALGAYVVERFLGAGAMSEVWLARNKKKQAIVIKRLHDHLAQDARSVDRFVDEAELAYRLQHPNLVHISEVSNASGIWFLVMEYVDGIELKAALELEHAPFKPAFAAHLAAQAAIGLAYAQGRKDSKGRPLGFVHRDIAPDNLMLDVAGIVRIVDFGIARMEDTGVTTQTGLRKGKLRYMSREYLRDHVFDSSTDVYALGATLYEMLTGARPFHELSSPVTLMDAILNRELPRASSLRPSIPRELDDIVFEATRADRRVRMSTAAELATRLLAFGKDWPPPPADDLAKQVKEWKAALTKRPAPGRHGVGAFGQLESTEAVAVAPPLMKPRKAHKGERALGKSVKVAAQTDYTDAVTAPALRALADEDEGPTEQLSALRPALPSVVLEPGLEALSKRLTGPVPKKRKRAR